MHVQHHDDCNIRCSGIRIDERISLIFICIDQAIRCGNRVKMELIIKVLLFLLQVIVNSNEHAQMPGAGRA